jgi:hypothetical protein
VNAETDGESALSQEGSASNRPADVAEQSNDLSSLERGLLALPVLGGLFFGLMPLLAPATLAQWGGYTGADRYIYRIAGAATLGYAVALILAIREGKWAPARIVIAATLAFNLAALLACILEISAGSGKSMLLVVLIASLLFAGITGWMLYSHRGATSGQPDVADWVVWLVVIAIVSAGIFGLLPLLVPKHFAEFFGYNGFDVIIYRLAGAATLGYAIMGIFELRSRNWNEMRLPAIMALVFNAAGFLSSAWSLTRQDDPKLLPLIVAVASLGVTLGTALTIQRNGK